MSTSSSVKRFRRLFRKARERAALKYEELAKRSGLSARYLEEIESGQAKPTMSEVLRVLTALPPCPEVSSLHALMENRLKQSPQSLGFLAELIRVAREDAGLTVRELARRSGVDAMYLSRMERGLIREKDWSKIALLLGQLPLSEFAKQAELSGAVQLRNSALQMAADLEKLLSSLPKATLADKGWNSVIADRLWRCTLILNANRREPTR